MNGNDLILRFTRLSPERYRFEHRLADGTGEVFDLEGEAELFHDLLHFAVESEAGLQGSFYGLLAKIGGYAELAIAGGQALGGEMAVTGRVVEALAEALREDGLDDEAFADQAAANLGFSGERPPRWFTPDFALRVRRRVADLAGRWLATPVGGTMELSFTLTR
ncbi:MAG TPA: hypothetical protein VHZ26_06800 [Caulobacteraceae bacterium]|jgi:hypothetical protein|nr:hypothetical protein [Caulobacteraceae bacterium]